MFQQTAKLADHSGSIHNFLGEKVDYVAGEDFIVLHGSNDYGVAKKEAFLATYTAFMGGIFILLPLPHKISHCQYSQFCREERFCGTRRRK